MVNNDINKRINHPSPLNTEKNDVGNPIPGLGQAYKSGGVTPVKGIQILL
jgi:hypothetical protein